jgi:hypothetical protein
MSGVKLYRYSLIILAIALAALLAGCDTTVLQKNDASLSSLVITDSNGNILPLSPTFSSTTISYTATVSSSATSLTVKATPSYSGATVTYEGVAPSTGNYSIVDGGLTQVNVVVTAANTTATTSGAPQQIYTVIVSSP